jgi:hypothetical protein
MDPKQHLVTLSLTLMWFALEYLAGVVSAAVMPKRYSTFNKKQRIKWDTTIVSQIHCIAVVFLAWHVFTDPAMMQERIYGTSAFAFHLLSFSGSYFVWDLVLSVRCFSLFGVGFVVHAVACLAVYR